MTFVLIFHLSLIVLGITADALVQKIKHKLPKKIAMSLIETATTAIVLSIAGLIILFVVNYFMNENDILDFVTKWWYMYIIIFITLLVHVFVSNYRLPFIDKIEEILNTDIVIEEKELLETKSDAQMIQSVSTQRIQIFASLAPVGIILPFLGKIFDVTSILEAEIDTVIAWFLLLFYALILWNSYATHSRASQLINEIEKQLLRCADGNCEIDNEKK